MLFRFPGLTCPDCGCRNLDMRHDYTCERTYESLLWCSCGRADDDVAALRRYTLFESYSDLGYLDEEDRFERNDKVRNGWLPDEREDENEILCENCHADADERDWITEEVFGGDDSASDDTEDEWLCHCGECGCDFRVAWTDDTFPIAVVE